MDTAKTLRQTAPIDISSALGLPPNATIGEALTTALRLLAEHSQQAALPPDSSHERLSSILEYCRPFIAKEDEEFLVATALLLKKQPGLTPWTPAQEAAKARQRNADAQRVREVTKKLFDDVPSGNPLQMYSPGELMAACLERLERSTGVSERLREAAGELASAVEAEPKKVN